MGFAGGAPPRRRARCWRRGREPGGPHGAAPEARPTRWRDGERPLVSAPRPPKVRMSDPRAASQQSCGRRAGARPALYDHQLYNHAPEVLRNAGSLRSVLSTFNIESTQTSGSRASSTTRPQPAAAPTPLLGARTGRSPGGVHGRGRRS